jgi:hypothetical protein
MFDYRLTCGIASLCFLLISSMEFAGDHEESTDIESLYDSHDWFGLRDAVRARKAPAFYRGAVASAFGDLQGAREQFGSVIKSAPKSHRAYQSHNMLAYLYSRTAQYRRALKEIEQMLSIRPDNASDQAGLRLYTALCQSLDQSVTERGHSKLRYELKIGSPFVSVSVNGKSVKYMFDTGLNISMMSESEAKRLGLTFYQIPTDVSKIEGSSGVQPQANYQIAIAEQVSVGAFHLSHVPFLVTSDSQEPWTDLQQGERGALGIAVLQAFRSLRFGQDGTLEINLRLKNLTAQPNLCFEKASPIVEAGFARKKLRLVLDTGAAESHLSIRFASEFAALVTKSVQKDVRDIHGIDGSRQVEAATLQELRLQLGGGYTLLRPAQVLLGRTNPDLDDFHGVLGWDLLSQARSITLDFESMALALE